MQYPANRPFTTAKNIIDTTHKLELLRAIDELLPAIFEKKKNAVLFVVNENENHFYDLTTLPPHTVVSDGNPEVHMDVFVNKVPFQGSVIAYHFDQLKEKQQPIIFSFEEDIKKYLYPYNQAILTGEYEEVYGALLQAGNHCLGILYVTGKQSDGWRTINTLLFQQVADLVAVALFNILAKEAILEKQREKNQLLEITELIAQVKDTEDLLRLIIGKIKPIFNFHDCGLFVLSPDGRTHTDLAAVMPNISPSEWNRKISAISENMVHKNSVLEWMMDTIATNGKPVLFDFLSLKKKFPEYPQLAESNIFESDYRDCLAFNLRVRGQIIGMFCINALQENFFTTSIFPFFQSITESIAIAIANILATEEILSREKEKTIQLKILETLNSKNSWDEKFTSVAQKFDAFIGCDLFSYSIRMNDGKRMGKGFIKLPDNSGFKINTLEQYLTDMGITEAKYRELYAHAMDFYTGSKLYTGAALKVASKKFELVDISLKAYNSHSLMFTEKSFPKGSILFILTSQKKDLYNDRQLEFLEATAQQMTLSVMNTLDNEEVTEREKQKTLEIKINNAVLTNENFRNVMKDIAESIGVTVGCDICYIRVMSDQIDPRPFQFYCERVNGNYVVRAVDNNAADSGAMSVEICEDAAVFLKTIEVPCILSGIQLEELLPQYQYLQTFRDKIGIKSFIFLPLQLKYNCTAYLVIGSRVAYSYISSDLELIASIKTQLSLALDNRLAFYQIQRLKEMLQTENLYLQEEINDNYNFNEIIGSSTLLKKVFTQASMVSGTDTTVLITGETGTGKELIARAIHNLSNRKDKIMVKVNCACLPAQLIESELFGHEKGAFTGASEKRIGKFELANGGTIFLDEIGELPLELQAKLLRVIQEREFERIGGRSVLKTDIRIIAATNKDLELESREKRFRSDLFYRLNVFPIQLPALKERKEDIPLLALHFAKKFGQKMRKNISAITNDALQEMIHYDWPGNIRELEHVVEHSVISSKSSKLSLARPLLITKNTSAKSLTEFRIKTLNDNEKEYILTILKYCNGRVRGNGGAAQLLAIHPNTLESRMVKLGIKKEHVTV